MQRSHFGVRVLWQIRGEELANSGDECPDRRCLELRRGLGLDENKRNVEPAKMAFEVIDRIRAQYQVIVDDHSDAVDSEITSTSNRDFIEIEGFGVVF